MTGSRVELSNATVGGPKLATGAPVQIKTGRVRQLDILRGIAVLLVLGIHSPAHRGQSGVLRPIDSFIHRFGWTGVGLFFVMSGFLIGSLLFTEIKSYGRFELRRFLARRALRIWPPYYCLMAYLFVQLATDPRIGVPGAWATLWPALIHIQNFILAPRDHLWSLAVEEHFYLLLPVGLWLVTRRGDATRALRKVPIACIVICGGSFLLRSAMVLLNHPVERWPTYFCIDGLFFGVNLAYLQAYRPEVVDAIVNRRWSLMLGFALLLPALSRSMAFQDVVAFSTVYVGYGLLLIHFVHVRPGSSAVGRFISSLPGRAIAAIGVSSYSIYLWHRDTGWWGYRLADAMTRALHLPGALSWLASTTAFMVAAILGGSLMERVFEASTMRWRARLFPARSGTARPMADARSRRRVQQGPESVAAQ